MNLPVISVSDLNRYVKTMFDSELMMQSILVSGEISNLSVHGRTGHMYFSLKDEASSLKAVMFASDARSLGFVPENGMKVTALGRISVFERDGVYQLYTKKMQPDGAGALAVAFEQLKKKLEAEGLFSQSRKKPLPRYPKKIGVITSPTGAAVRDIFSVIKRRYPCCTVIFKGVSVQGAGAANEMIDALEEFGRKKCADVIIIGRGGGSAEDLWCFNDELLARAVAACPIPVVSGVGHETDFTICDFVSDLRAPTPSAAAEIVTPDIDSMKMDAAVLSDRLFGAINRRMEIERRNLGVILSKRNFNDPGDFFTGEKSTLAGYKAKLRLFAEKKVHENRIKHASFSAKLDSLNPLSVLLRGFATVSVNGKYAVKASELNTGDEVRLRFSDGEVGAVIK